MDSVEKLLEQARKQREQAKSALALDTCTKALLLAQRKGNREQLIQVFVDREIVWRHMFEGTNDITFAILARQDAHTILDMVKMWGVSERLHTAYFMLGQAALLFQDYVEAENYFFKSLRYFKGSQAEKGSWRYHWAKALYKIGEKKRALLAFSQAINEIKARKKTIDTFLYNVYLSGAYANFAFVLKKDDSKTAQRYFDLAKEIIDSDKRLVVRKKQFKELAKHFKGR